MFVGWNEYAARLAQTFKSSPASAYQVIGYIHGRADEGTEPSITYLGAFEEAELIISSIAIDILILADLDYERHRVSAFGECVRARNGGVQSSTLLFPDPGLRAAPGNH